VPAEREEITPAPFVASVQADGPTIRAFCVVLESVNRERGARGGAGLPSGANATCPIQGCTITVNSL
jgi:hypothetical protein